MNEPNSIRNSKHRGISIIEVIVILAVIALLIALLLPGVYQAREAARRTQCKNNLKTIGLAIYNYESTFKGYPLGVNYTASNGYGISFWIALQPYLDHSPFYQIFDFSLANGIGDVTVNAHNGGWVNGKVFPANNCPSSPMPRLGSPISNAPLGVNIPSYAGNAGVVNGKFGNFTEKRASAPFANGVIGTGGFFVHSKFMRVSDMKDGVANTIALGEQSDWCIDTSNNARFDCRSGGPGNPQVTVASEQDAGQGFLIGTRFPFDQIGRDGDAQFSLTTTKYAPGSKRFDRAGGSMPGINVAASRSPNSGSGVNFSFQSAHVGGLHILLADGTVKFISNEIKFDLFKSLLTRDDGIEIGDY